MIKKLFFAGSGGQGVLLMGQAIAYAAMAEDLEVTFLPSYGPEMRGGTANCTVVVSDKPISSPLIFEADAVIAMNLPSLIKFESLVKPGASLIVNSSLVEQKATRDDINAVYVPCNDLAVELGNPRCANIVMLGAVLRELDFLKPESIEYSMKKIFSGKKEKLLPLNMQALDTYKK